MDYFFSDRKWICLLLLLLTCAVYYQVAQFDFVNLDDNVNVYENGNIQDGITVNTIQWAFTASYWGTWQPLVWLSFMADYKLHGLFPGGYHLTNIFFHLCNVLLLYLVLRRMTGAPYRSAFIACLFSIHPIHVESVAWITERKDVLSAFFFMLVLWAYDGYAAERKKTAYLLVCLFTGLGLMAKPMLVTIPFVLLLLDFWPLGRVRLNAQYKGVWAVAKEYQGLLWEKIPLFMLSLASSIMTIYAQKQAGAIKSISLIPLPVRISNALVAYMEYLVKLIWPFDLIVFYPHPRRIILSKFLAAGLVISGICIFSIWKMRKYPWLFTGWFFYLGVLFPVIGIIQIGSHAMADRFVYIPAIGIYILFAWGGGVLLERYPGNKRLPLSRFFVFLLLLSTITWQQVSYWKNSGTLFAHALQVSENNFIANNNYGLYLRDQGQTDKAIDYFRKAIENKNDYVLALNNLGVSLENVGKPDKAVPYYEKAIRLKPDFFEPYVNLAFIIFHKGKYQEAMMLGYKALRLDPVSEKAYLIIADSVAAMGDFRTAENLYNRALEINPKSHLAHNRLGALYVKMGYYAKAVRHLRAALRYNPHGWRYQENLASAIKLDENRRKQINEIRQKIRSHPNNEELLLHLSGLLEKSEKTDESAALYQKALTIAPHSVSVLQGIADFYIRRKNNKKAIAYYKKLYLCDPGNKIYSYNIACLFARQGLKTEAIQWLDRAIDAGFLERGKMTSDPDLAGLRNSSQFARLLKKIDRLIQQDVLNMIAN